MKAYRTEQEHFWAGDFGDDYAARNRGAGLTASNLAMFAEILSYTVSVGSVIELGANIGLNLQAIRLLLPETELSAVEINKRAVDELGLLDNKIRIYHKSVLDFSPDYKRDFVFTKGVLIHIDPARLPDVYDLLYRGSKRYICIAEYYNPKPVSIPYRGHEDKLFKRDFAGEILDRFGDLKLVKYGFVYHRDVNFPQDDIFWFLFEKGM
ncbi:MAG: hypothetical protein M0Z71_08060 [Nitrospiraceae bacterium]|nr:hypothetical protein [Nitrospiraceae bacterium]